MLYLEVSNLMNFLIRLPVACGECALAWRPSFYVQKSAILKRHFIAHKVPLSGTIDFVCICVSKKVIQIGSSKEICKELFDLCTANAQF